MVKKMKADRPDGNANVNTTEVMADIFREELQVSREELTLQKTMMQAHQQRQALRDRIEYQRQHRADEINRLKTALELSDLLQTSCAEKEQLRNELKTLLTTPGKEVKSRDSTPKGTPAKELQVEVQQSPSPTSPPSSSRPC